ncbi:methyl-accepting chemotaxis protein [uncultured Pseudodesulfovibrio sp.]|uniref:methyl-accepting chemotaxis protein n=1 Tax=uncultured Pseudodesulfovibrio sp. TaxID=2035858 RepID=UPI0029C69F9A|nr:methyl-accepting chemotaxis protein [uncultured Pseudodesulfovibrio sp.]
MPGGARVSIVFAGFFLCCAFAVSSFLGGWFAFGVAAGISIILIIGLVFMQGRVEAAQRTLVDEMKSELAETQREKVYFSSAIREVGNPVLVCDREGRIVSATQSLLSFLKKPADQVVGQKVSKAFYGTERKSIAEQVLATHRELEDTVELSLWDGRKASVRLFANPVYDESGDVSGVVTSYISLDEMLAQQREIESQRERMAQAGSQISELAEHVASATELLSAAADDQAQGAQKQRGQTSSVATAMEEMTATVIEVAQNAAGTSDAADVAYNSASEGVSMVTKAVAAINEVAESAEQLGREVGELDDQAGEIGRIISVINDIADQTNLLALNAAIEAARAGEAGRGFAVVADEVRKLAEKTVTATREVEEAIGTIQDRSQHASRSMRQTEVQVQESTELSNQAGEALQQIMESIKDMVGRVSQIATAAEQQSSAAEEINKSIEEIADIASDADEAAGQAASATRDLAGLAQDLLNVSKEFRDGDGEVRLRESTGEMKGILPKLTQGFVQQKYGDAVYDGMQNDLGNPVFLPTESYPDQVLMQMAESVSSSVGISIRNFFLELGRFTVGRFNEMYPAHFKNESLKEFYLRMNEVHAQLTKDHPGIHPPNFTYEDKGDDLFMNYRSSRGLFDYFEGILLGAAEFKGEAVTVKVKPFDETTARAEIVFHGKV